MGEIKPLGSEKLSGDEKINRILQLTYYQNPINENKKTNKNFELIVEGKNSMYGIQKEKDGYYVKKGINESSLDYIGGLYMKNKNRFTSYNDALKRLEFLKGQEELNEATKYVLRNKGVSEPSNIPSPIEPPVPSPTPEDTVVPSGEELPVPEDDFSTGVEGDDEETGDPLKDIQKLTGKLTQKIRDAKDDIKSEDGKYVVNMVISSVDDILEDDDIDEIITKLEGDEETDSEELPTPEDGETPEDDLGETYASLEELTNTDFDFDDEEDEIDITNEFDDDEDFDTENDELDDIHQHGNYYDNDSDFEMYEEETSNSDVSISLEELIDLADKAGKTVVDAKYALMDLAITSRHENKISLNDVEEVLHEYDMTIDDLEETDELYDNESYDVNFDNGNEDNEPESLDEFDLFGDDDFIGNANEYDIENDDFNLDKIYSPKNLSNKKSKITFDDASDFEDEDDFEEKYDTFKDEDVDDEEEDYGTLSRKNRRSQYRNETNDEVDEPFQLNEIKDIIKKYRIN